MKLDRLLGVVCTQNGCRFELPARPLSEIGTLLSRLGEHRREAHPELYCQECHSVVFAGVIHGEECEHEHEEVNT